jgi:uncharacterized integral membrane protein
MWVYLAFYFGFNAVLAAILWLLYRNKISSSVGFFFMMILFGLPLIVILCIIFIVLVLMGGSYQLGSFIESRLTGHTKKS